MIGRTMNRRLGKIYGGLINNASPTFDTTTLSASTPAKMVRTTVAGITSGVTASTDGKLTVPASGDYLLTGTAQASSANSSNNVYEFAARVNDLNPVVVGRINNNNVAKSVSLSGYLTLSASDVVDIWVENQTDADNLIIAQYNLQLTKVS